MNITDQINSKILNNNTVSDWVLNNINKKIVFTNGCFDIIHLGHIDYLSKAKMLGDLLFVGINSDTSVSKLKGHNRPLQDQISRLKTMASLFFVDAVMVFNEDTPINLIEKIKPAVLVKGGDYIKQTIVGYDFVVENGGIVETIEFIPGYSTSLIEKKIIENFLTK